MSASGVAWATQCAVTSKRHWTVAPRHWSEWRDVSCPRPTLPIGAAGSEASRLPLGRSDAPPRYVHLTVQGARAVPPPAVSLPEPSRQHLRGRVLDPVPDTLRVVPGPGSGSHAVRGYDGSSQGPQVPAGRWFWITGGAPPPGAPPPAGVRVNYAGRELALALGLGLGRVRARAVPRKRRSPLRVAGTRSSLLALRGKAGHGTARGTSHGGL